MRLSSPDQPTRLALLFLRLSSLVVDVQPKRGERAQQLGCRFLLALLLIDALSWGAFRLVAFEAIRNARYAYSLDPSTTSPVIFITISVRLARPPPPHHSAPPSHTNLLSVLSHPSPAPSPSASSSNFSRL